MSTKSESKKIVKKDLISLFWRAFLLPACYSMDRMQAPGFAYSILPVLKKLYGDDKEKLAEACSRHSEVYNNTFACSPFVLGIVAAMEEEACANPDFDVNSINAIKVALMGPLSGIGDTFFWGTLETGCWTGCLAWFGCWPPWDAGLDWPCCLGGAGRSFRSPLGAGLGSALGASFLGASGSW